MAGYSRHLVAFIDFLGFSEAMRDSNRAESILGILAKLASFQGDYWADSKKTDDGRQYNVRPAISVFSDNVVVSYPLEEAAEHQLDESVLVFFLQNLISYIAWNAFEAGLLLRGGIAIGPAYHSQGIVFGPALIEA